ncbi:MULTISPECIES: efflux RND transporter periplasmic adaptor subunit [unclassified Cyanobium]|uniref:efflux RND transporter periplasmic adaptor subunit n=1 Tax=unclassified Cyanobium TaxID=2627006 RepID=UPI0020CFC00B|nr:MULTISPECIES: efflux RND transporter periplasmic adaptor subunit [unclassified Cyanobium]MCP9834848.1 efflux RND transporter periplasmic adaptor subunit [Cyanobium sp. La Preciosa 7G6]MCP9937528.1 efflux RND transporter periplasmic adaptor subunit [Cyanobium sp. Aljojuca 7A6]
MTSVPAPAPALPSPLRRARWGRPAAVAATATAATVAGLAVALGVVALRPRPPVLRPLPVSLVTAQPVSQYLTSRDYTGEVVAGRSSSLGFELPGSLEQVLVEQGDRVERGQPLARLDRRRLLAQRQQLLAQQRVALAAVEEVRQQLILAELQRDRRRQLHAQGAISREDLDQQIHGSAALRSRLVQAESQVDDAGGRLRQIDVDLARSVLLAPFAGTVSRRLLDEGVVVSGGQALISLVEAAPQEVRVGVPPAVAQGLRLGERHPVQVGERRLLATVSALLPELDAGSRTTTVVLRLPLDNLPVGATARLSLRRSERGDGFWLPTTALVAAEQGLWSVYVLAPAGTTPERGRQVVRRLVDIVHSEGDRSLVRGTLRPGERVIAAGTQRVVPGVWVQEAL